MAARTFTSAGVNNLWSNPANWDGGATIPQENDSVTIPAGQTCEYDYNSAYTTGIAGITITGTLKLTRAAGTYRLFMKAAATINGAGTFDCGTLASPILFAVKHTITGGSGWYIDGAGGLTMTVYAAEPVVKFVTLSATENSGQTVLSIDTDLTGEAQYWKAGDIVYIASSNSNAVSVHTIVSVSATELEVTPALAGNRVQYTSIMMMTRNVRFITSVGTVTTVKNFSSGKLTIAGGEFRGETSRLFTNCLGIRISGGSFYSVGSQSHYFDTCHGALISGGVFTNSSVSSNRMIISGGAFQGFATAISGNGNTFNGGRILSGANYATSGSGLVINDIYVRGCNYGIQGTGVVNGGTIYTNQWNGFIGRINNAYFESFAWQGIFAGIPNTKFFNVRMAHSTGKDFYDYASYPVENYTESFDHNQVAGAYKAWTTGGITTKQAVTYPVGYDNSMQTVLENAAEEGYWQKEIIIGAGASVNITMNLCKDASMAYLPRVIIFNKGSTDPFAGGAGLYTFTMTDSIDTWEDDLYTYTNSTSEDITLVIRCQGMNATGNMYSALLVEQINVDLTNAIAKIDVIDGLVDAIKAKTDQLAFTVANQVDANALTGGASAEDVADAVWDEAIADHAVGTTFGGKNQKVVPSESVNDYKADVSSLATTLHVREVEDKVDVVDGVVDAIKLKTDNLPVSPAAVGSAMTLTAAYDRSKDDVLTPLSVVDGIVDEIKAKTTNLPSDPASNTVVNTRLSSGAYVAPANADIAAIKAKTDNLPASPADQSELEVLIAALPPAPSASDIIAALKVAVFDGTLTFEDSIKLYNAILFGKLDGGGSGTLKFRDPTDTKDRVTATVDISTGDRDDITLDLT